MTKSQLSAVVLSVVLACPAVAQVPDHLKCYKVKDPAPRATYTADLTGLVAPEPGCVIKVPAKMLCVETAKTGVSPTPPGAPAGPPTGRFLCYRLKCPASVLPPVAVSDQFGGRSVRAKASMLCAPATVPTMPTMTTTTTSTTTTTMRCHFDAASNACQGGCPLAGQQCTLTASDRCDCLPPSCHTCYVTVTNSCTAKLCSSHNDCIDQPNELCLADQCDVACP